MVQVPRVMDFKRKVRGRAKAARVGAPEELGLSGRCLLRASTGLDCMVNRKPSLACLLEVRNVVCLRRAHQPRSSRFCSLAR